MMQSVLTKIPGEASTPFSTPFGPATLESLPGADNPSQASMEISNRLRDQGAAVLSTPELLSVLLSLGRHGSEESCLNTARKMLSETGGLLELRRSRATDLVAEPGIGESRAHAICAAIELGSRIATAERPVTTSVNSPQDVDHLIRPRIGHMDREVFSVILLNVKNRVIAVLDIAIGTLSSAAVHPREIFKPAIKASAAGIIVAHNHPSGSTSVSQQDRDFTRRLAAAGETIGIELLDHIIIGDPGFTSMKEIGIIS